MIRHAIKEDIGKINSLGIIFNSNFKQTYKIEEYLKNNNYIILVNDDDDVNAFMIIYKNIDYFELEAIIVKPSSRKKGIANNLMDFFVDKYTKKNDIILLEVAINNVEALSLYNKFNFEIISIRKKYYNGIDAYVMKKVI